MKLELKAVEKSTGELNLQRNTRNAKAETPAYDGGFHISRADSVGRVNFSGSKMAANERVANARSSLQGFTCK